MVVPKIILIQLPLQEVGELYVAENVPLAAGYLLCALKEAGLGHRVDARIMSQNLMDFGGDAQIIDAVACERPDMVGFSCYCWNIERSMLLAKEIKKISPHTLILFGGPEIAENHMLNWGSHVCDMAVVGEGEGPFVEIVQAILQGMREFSGIPRLRLSGHGAPFPPPALSGKEILPRLNPYLEGFLTPPTKGTVYVETVRGCRFSCSYCYYPKSFPGIRNFPSDLLRNVFSYARDIGASEICFLDPSFNTNPHFPEICRILAQTNRDKTLAVHAELRADFLSEEDVTLLAEANLKTAELGLQSIHNDTLKILRRPCRIDHWIRGMKMLREREVKIRCDLILGLPGEDLDKMHKNVNFLAKNELGDEAQIFHLHLLPGTDLRKDSSRYGIRYQKSPPHTVIETSAASHTDLAEAFSYAQEHLGIEVSPMEGGPFLLTRNKESEIFCGEDILSDPIKMEENIRYYRRRVPNRLRIWFKACNLDIFKDAVVGFVSGIHQDNTFTLLEIILEAKIPFSTDLPKMVLDYGTFPSHYINKSHYYIDRTGLRSTRLITLFPLKTHTHPLVGVLRDQVEIYFRIPTDLPAISPEALDMAEGFFFDLPNKQIDWTNIHRRYKDLPLFFRYPAHFMKMGELRD